MKMIAGAIVVLAGAILGSSAMLALSFAKESVPGTPVSVVGLVAGIILALLGLLVLHRGEKETKHDDDLRR